jgi:type I site-specific restriction endonuclease
VVDALRGNVALKEASNMLRQQAQKIENLLDQYQRLNENLEMWKTGHFKQQAEIEQLRKIVEDTIGQAFYEDDYHKAKAEIEQLKALVISLSPNANLIYTKSKK